MKHVFCIAAVSVETTGEWLIAKDTKHFVGWVHPTDKEFFRKMVGRAGVAVMGRNTYLTFPKSLPYARNVVYSRPHEEVLPGAEMTREPPGELVARLSKEPNVNAIAVIGGADIYTQFMKAGVVDTFYVTLHHNVQFGKGIPLFADATVKLPEKPTFKKWLDNEHTAELYTYQFTNKKALAAN